MPARADAVVVIASLRPDQVSGHAPGTETSDLLAVCETGLDLPMVLATDRATEAWYYPSIA